MMENGDNCPLCNKMPRAASAATTGSQPRNGSRASMADCVTHHTALHYSIVILIIML